MGKFRTKLKGQTKGQRWPKGQSSNSNPRITKYRDMAKFRYFQINTGPSNLTTDALKHHTANYSHMPDTKMDMDHDEYTDIESYDGTYSSYSGKSFASEWSGCTNMSYSRFMNVFNPSSALHKEMLTMLAAIQEVIKEKGGTGTVTEYYCLLETTLEGIYNEEPKNEDKITAVLACINMNIKNVSESILKLHFGDLTKKMLHILKDYANSENNTIIKSVFGILGVILKAQELAAWSQASVSQVFAAMLDPFCVHSKPKWRKAAQRAAALVINSDKMVSDSGVNPPADKAAEFCENTLLSCMGGTSGTVLVSSVQAEQTTILHTLSLMKDIMSKFSKNHIKKCCELILKLMTLNYPIVTACGMQVLHTLFSAQNAVMPAKLNAQLISALYEYQPSISDVQPIQAWVAVMQQAHIHLADIDVPIAAASLPKIFDCLTQLWLSEKAMVMSAATHSLDALIKDALSSVCASKELVEQHKSKIEKCINCIQLGLGYQYNTSWHQVLYVISTLFEVTGTHCADLLLGLLKSLAELRDSYKFSYNNELEHAVGSAIRSMGPETVLKVISLKKVNGDFNMDRSWLLPVLKTNVKFSTLDYAVKEIIPLAMDCYTKSMQLAQNNDGIGAHSSELLYLQLWSLLPSFCAEPKDIKANFKSLAKVMGAAISDKKELRLAVMAALRKLIMSAKNSENQEDIQEVARFDKNYLPILFNLYTTKPIGTDEEGQRLAALDTIKLYLSIARPELTKQLFVNAIERLNGPSDEPEEHFIKESLLDIIRALIPYQSIENINILYQQCIKNLPELKNNKEQKKAYRLLEEICGSETADCQKFVRNNGKEVQRLLTKSLNSAAVSSKGARLRCLNHLIKAQPQIDHESKLIRSAIPEAILCCKDINEKCRKTAYELLNTIGNLLLEKNRIDEFLQIVIAGLAGSPQLISCTILALTSLLHNFTGTLKIENIKIILNNICTLCTSPTREIVASCLIFLKVYITRLPNPIAASSLELLMKSLTGMTEDCKRHFRLKVRDVLDRLVRKYGAESLTQFIPHDDTVMYKRLRNLRKLNDRKKRRKEAEKEEEYSDDEEFAVKPTSKSFEEILADSDSDFEDVETDEPKIKNKRQPSTWIQEEPESIVDFVDPTSASKISTTKPGVKPSSFMEKKKIEKDRGFKTSADGRLIIKDDSDNEDDNDKKFLKFNSDSDSDDEGSKSEAETAPVTNLKRKRTTSSVKSGFSTASSQTPSKYKHGGIGIHRPIHSSTSSVKSGYSTPGSEFTSKKAKGDIKKKGKFDPYAYLPLQRTALNKRKRAKAAGQFKNIVKAAKLGAAKGTKSKRKNK